MLRARPPAKGLVGPLPLAKDSEFLLRSLFRIVQKAPNVRGARVGRELLGELDVARRLFAYGLRLSAMLLNITPTF